MKIIHTHSNVRFKVRSDFQTKERRVLSKLFNLTANLQYATTRDIPATIFPKQTLLFMDLRKIWPLGNDIFIERLVISSIHVDKGLATVAGFSYYTLEFHD